MKMASKLWMDEAGFIVSSELVLLATIVVIGLIVGLTTVRDNVVMELADVADAISEVNQGYSFSGVTGHSSSTAGSVFADLPDFCEIDSVAGSDQISGSEVSCIEINGIAATPE